MQQSLCLVGFLLLVTATTNAEKPKWYGLSPSVSLANDSSLNAEPDSFSDVFSTGFSLGFATGKVFAPKSYLEPLSASLDFSVAGELAGNGGDFRDSNFETSARPTFEAIPQSCYAAIQAGETVGNECFPRQVDSGTQSRIDYSDVKFAVSHGKLATVPYLGLTVSGRASATLPTSLQSRNEGLYTSLGWGGGLSRSFLGDKLSLSYGLSFAKPLRQSDTFIIHSSKDPAPEINGTEASTFSPDNGASRFTTFSLTNSFTASYSLPLHLGLSLSYSLTDSWKASLDDCTVELTGSSVKNADVCANRFGDIDDGKTQKASQLFVASLGWDAASWLSLGIALTTSTPLRKPNSEDFYQPFVHTDRNGFTAVGLSATVPIAELYSALQ